MGGDLASAALTNAYYPASNRGVGPVFQIFVINTGERVFTSLVQEFIVGKFLSKVKNRD
jgi:hypothetical protein